MSVCVRARVCVCVCGGGVPHIAISMNEEKILIQEKGDGVQMKLKDVLIKASPFSLSAIVLLPCGADRPATSRQQYETSTGLR